MKEYYSPLNNYFIKFKYQLKILKKKYLVITCKKNNKCLIFRKYYNNFLGKIVIPKKYKTIYINKKGIYIIEKNKRYYLEEI